MLRLAFLKRISLSRINFPMAVALLPLESMLTLSLFGVLNQNASGSPDSNKQRKGPEVLGKVSLPLFDFRRWCATHFSSVVDCAIAVCVFVVLYGIRMSVFQLIVLIAVYWEFRLLGCFVCVCSYVCLYVCFSRVLARGTKLLCLWTSPQAASAAAGIRRKNLAERIILQVTPRLHTAILYP